MDINQFEIELWASLSKLDYIQEIQISLRNEEELKSKVWLKEHFFLRIFFNQVSLNINFSLIYLLKKDEDKRLWGLDRDNRIGWHTHPVENPKDHVLIEEKTVAEIIEIFDQTWQKIKNKNY